MDIVKENGGCNPHQLQNALNAYLSENNVTTSTKRKRVMATLVCASQKNWKLTRFDLEIIGDHCLNTTISEIGRYDGVEVSRRNTKRPTRFGKPTDCKEYWLEPIQIAEAEKQLSAGGKA